MKRKKGFDKSFIFLFFIIAILIGVSIFIYMKFKTDRVTEALEQNEQITVAFFISQGDELLFTEVFFYNPETRKGALLDVPRQLGSIIAEQKKIDRIEVLYEQGKVGTLIRKIETLIDHPVPFYFEISLDQIENLVDLLEGMEMFIANPVEIIAEERVVLLPSGSMVLDGAKIKTYLSYEGDDREPDIEKINRKQKFVQSFLHKLGDQYEELRRNDVFPYLKENVKTNLDDQSIRAFMEEMRHLDVERIIFQRVLGVERVVDGKSLLFPHYDGKLLKETVSQTLDSLASSEIAAEESLTVSIELLNGTTRNGLASRTSHVFKSFGYDVVHVGNADSFDYEETVVIDRTGDINKAQKAASVINCKKVQTMTDSEGELDSYGADEIDVTVILGKDFDGRYCKN